LFQTGLGAGAVLLLLGTMFSYLKLDTETRGYYTGRLQFGAAGVILAIIAAGVVCANWIPWM
jgi:purine-cytosine permease-like protein